MKRRLLSTAVAAALVAAPLTAASADTAGSMGGPLFQRNLSNTPDRASSKAKIDGFQFYVPARAASGAKVDVEYRDAGGRLVESRDQSRPLVSVYTDDAADPAQGDDVWSAYSRDDGDTWQRVNLSDVAGRSSYTIDDAAYPGMVSKPLLMLKGNRVVVAWTSSYCDSGFPGYDSLIDDPHKVRGAQRSVDYGPMGFPEVGQVPYKCLWAARGQVNQTSGELTWYQPERLTSGVRYAMQISGNSAPGVGFVLAWGEDPSGLAPGSGSGPGEGWTGAHPNPGTDVWYSYLPMSDFTAVATDPVVDPDDPADIAARPQPARTWSVPVPVSDNAGDNPNDATVGATRPAVAMSVHPTGAWVAYGYEETKEGEASETDPEQGKRVIHHAFAFDDPDVDSAGQVISPADQSARRVRYISQPYAQMGPSRTVGTLLYRMGTDGHSGSADFIMQRFVVPATDDVAVDNPFRGANLTGPTNVSATTTRTVVDDPVTGERRTDLWVQTARNLTDGTGVASRESARGHRGMIKGDFLAVGYLWTPNWSLFLRGRDIENYYVRRSFDGGATFTTAPGTAPYNGDGVRSCRWTNNPLTGKRRAPVCTDIGPGAFEPAQNLSRLDGFDDSAIEPRLPGMPGTITGSPYPEDVQDTAVLWQAWGTGLPKSAEGVDPEDGDADVPVPDEGGGKAPLDIYYTVSQDYGDTYLRNARLAGGSAAQAELQMRFSPDGSKMYAVWNEYGPGALDVQFSRVMPDVFPYNTTEGALELTGSRFSAGEGDNAVVSVQRVIGRRGNVKVSYHTEDGTALAGRDYEPQSGQLVFEQGDVGPQTIVVPTIQNDADAPDVSFTVVLDGFEGVVEGFDPQRATVTITDDEDFTAPGSRASSPRVTNRSVIPVTYTAGDKESGVDRVVLYVRRPDSANFRKVAVDDPADGRIRYATGGRNGVYRFYTVAVDRAGNREKTPGGPDSRTRLDTVAPRLRYAAARPQRFDISRDGFVQATFRLSERAQVRLVVRRDGAVVRRQADEWKPAGRVVRRWYGLDDQGHLVRAGHYVLVVRATDRAGNAAVRRFGLTVRR